MTSAAPTTNDVELLAPAPAPARAKDGRLRRAVTWASRAVESLDVFDTCAIASLITLLMYGPKPWYARAIVGLLGTAMLLVPQIRRSSVAWYAMFCATAAAVFLEWHRVDNHKYLTAYWVLAVFVALKSTDPARTLALSARWILALVMGFAVAWKVASTDYLSGEFFRHALVFDPRFSSIARLLDIDRSVIMQDRQALVTIANALRPDQASEALQSHVRLDQIARFITYFGLGVEAAIAVCFVAPARSLLGRWRDLPLLVFLATTYSLATVVGFAYLLAAMAFAQARRPWARLGYVAIIPWIQLYTMQMRVFL